MDGEPFDRQILEEYKALSSAKDIMEAVLKLSRKRKGQVMIKLLPADKNEESAIWFGPGFSQEEYDDPESYGNSMIKFVEEVDAMKLRIVGIEPLIMNPGESYGEALERFAAGKRFKLSNPNRGRWYYPGRLNKKIMTPAVNTP